MCNLTTVEFKLIMTIRELVTSNSTSNPTPSEISHLVSDGFNWHEIQNYSDSMDSIDLRFFEKVNNRWVEVLRYVGCGGEKGIVIKRLPLSGSGVVVGGVKRWAQMYINANAQTLANGMGVSLQPKEDGTPRTFEDDGKELFNYDSSGEKVGSGIVKASAAAAGSVAAAMAITSRGKSFIKDPDSLNTIREGFTGVLRKKQIDMPDVPVKEVAFYKRSKEEVKVLRNKFNSTERGKFAKSLADTPEKRASLKKSGFTDEDVNRLQTKRMPDGYQVHHKLPLKDSGTNKPSNLVLIKNHPYHKAITIEQQILTKNIPVGDTKNISFPIPKGSIYPLTKPD